MSGVTTDSTAGVGERLGRADFAMDAESLAVHLLGQRLVRIGPAGERLAGRIVEVEAYLGREDAGAHSFGGHRSQRNESMYGPPGLCYVYFTYGMHYCMNVVAGAAGEPVAVLLRALAPTEGPETMRENRMSSRRRSPLRDRDLCSGPAKLCQALGVDRAFDGRDLTSDAELFVERARATSEPAGEITRSARVGLSCGGEWGSAPLRWSLKGSPHVSRP